MDSDSDYEEEFEITEDKIQSMLKFCANGSSSSIKKLLKLYHNAIKCRCSKKDENRNKFFIEESVYLDLIAKSQEYASILFNQTGPVVDEGQDYKIKITAKTFVLDTIQLVSSNKSFMDSIKLSLITLSKPNILRWIVAIGHVELHFLKIVFKILSNYPNQGIRLSSFSLLKCYLDMIMLPEYNLTQYGHALHNGLKKYNPNDLSTTKINNFSIGIYKSYLRSLSKGLNPKNWTLSRLSRNCVVELLVMIHSDKLYIVAFRQLRKIGKDTIDAWKKSKLDSICNWAFVESLTIWATVIGRTTPKLDHLVYPLVTISTASLKLGQNNERFAPFILCISKELNHLSRDIDKFIPIASHLLTLLDKLSKSKEYSKVKMPTIGIKNNENNNNNKLLGESHSAYEDTDAEHEYISDEDCGIHVDNHAADKRKPMPELAIFKLSLSQNNKDYNDIMYHVEDLSRIIITQHISLLAHHPSFPEIILPIVKHLKKHKNSKPWIRKLLGLIDESADRIRSLRKEIKFDKVNLDKLIFFKTSKIPIITHSFREMELLEKGIASVLVANSNKQ